MCVCVCKDITHVGEWDPLLKYTIPLPIALWPNAVANPYEIHFSSLSTMGVPHMLLNSIYEECIKHHDHTSDGSWFPLPILGNIKYTMYVRCLHFGVIFSWAIVNHKFCVRRFLVVSNHIFGWYSQPPLFWPTNPISISPHTQSTILIIIEHEFTATEMLSTYIRKEFQVHISNSQCFSTVLWCPEPFKQIILCTKMAHCMSVPMLKCTSNELHHTSHVYIYNVWSSHWNVHCV